MSLRHLFKFLVVFAVLAVSPRYCFGQFFFYESGTIRSAYDYGYWDYDCSLLDEAVLSMSPPSDVPLIIDWLGTTNNCGHPSQPGCRLELMPYKNDCLQEANPLSSRVSRADRSANELVAWAVREGMRGNKWRAVAWLALGECHDGPARKAINDNKKEAFDYVMAHYVAVWRHVDPDHDGGNGQALREGQEGCGDSIEDCVGDDVISTIQIPAGLAVNACKDEDCDGHHGNDCHTFVGPGTWSGNGAIGPHGGGIGFLHDEISYFRVFRP